MKLLRDAHVASKYDTDTITSSLCRTDINKEMKGAVTSAIERQETVPNPSEKNKTKLRKVYLCGLFHKIIYQYNYI